MTDGGIEHMGLLMRRRSTRAMRTANRNGTTLINCFIRTMDEAFARPNVRGRREASRNFTFFEIALVLVRFNHIASVIANADHKRSGLLMHTATTESGSL